VSPEEATLARVVATLQRLAIPYMVTGSIATSYHGRPRATHDADLVIDPTPPQTDALVEALAAYGFYLDPDRARAAVRRRGQFNAIETRHASKIDLIVCADRPFSRTELERRIPVDLPFATGVSMASPEDAIVSKLELARKSGDSERQLADARGVLDVTPSVDRAYIAHWAEELGVSDLWYRIAGRE
jgi:hypothetical protein